MIKNIKYSCVILLAVSLISCATPYGKAGVFGGYAHGGYNDVRVNGNTATISFNANSFTQPDQVQRFMLYRAAAVTIENGYDYFVVVSSSTSRTNINLAVKKTFKPTSLTTSMMNSVYEVDQIQSYSTSPTNAGQCSNENTSPCTARSRTVVIKMFNGPVPNGIPRTYSALDVTAQYSPGTGN